MGRALAVLALAGALAGCGLAGSGAAGGAAEVKEAAEAKKTEARVHEQLDEAFKQAADQRQNAEKEGQ
jgi:hypothetical protein